jgi:hypothetical protein
MELETFKGLKVEQVVVYLKPTGKELVRFGQLDLNLFI